MSAAIPLFGPDFLPTWDAPEPLSVTARGSSDPLEDLDVKAAERKARAEDRRLQRRRQRTAACSCERGPWLGRDEDGDIRCQRCGKRAPS